MFKITSFIIVRACHKCREYVHINPADPNNQQLINIFESDHEGHPIVSVALSELKIIMKMSKMNYLLQFIKNPKG